MHEAVILNAVWFKFESNSVIYMGETLAGFTTQLHSLKIAPKPGESSESWKWPCLHREKDNYKGEFASQEDERDWCAAISRTWVFPKTREYATHLAFRKR